MKITSESADQLVLEEGSAAGMVAGAAFVIGGIAAGYFLRASTQYAIWIGLAIVVVGVLLILFASAITVTVNRKTGKLMYDKKRLVGGQNAAFAIADILRIETRRQWQTQNRPVDGDANVSAPQTVLIAQSVIVFKDGRELALDHQKTSSTTQVGSAVLMGGQGNEIALAAKLAGFMNVPFQEISPPNMGTGVNINIM